MPTVRLQITRAISGIFHLGLASVALLLDLDMFLFDAVLNRIRASI